MIFEIYEKNVVISLTHRANCVVKIYFFLICYLDYVLRKITIFILTSFNRTPKNKKVKVKQSLISLVSEFLNSIHRPNEFLGKSTLHFTEPCFNYTYFDIMIYRNCASSL